MALNIPNWGSISAHAGPIPVWVWFPKNGVGVDVGALVLQADPQNNGADLVTTNSSIIRDGGSTFYRFDLTNRGSQPTSFKLAGGQVV